MSFLEPILTTVGPKLGLTKEWQKAYVKILEDNWIDSLQTLRGMSAKSLQRLGIPDDLSAELLLEVETQMKQRRLAAAQQHRLSETNNDRSGDRRASTSRRKNNNGMPSPNRKRVKPDPFEDSVIEIGTVKSRPAILRDGMRTIFGQFITKNAEKMIKRQSLLTLRGLITKIKDHPEQLSARSIDTRRPENEQHIFKHPELKRVFELLNFEPSGENRLFLAEPNFKLNELLICIELIDTFLINLEDMEIEVGEDSKSGVIEISESSRSSQSVPETVPEVAPELQAKIDALLNKIHSHYRYKLQPLMTVRTASSETPVMLEKGGHLFSTPALETQFDKIRDEFDHFYKEIANKIDSLSLQCRRTLKLVQMILYEERIELTLKMNAKESIELLLSKSESVAKIFAMVRKHIIKSNQQFYFFEPLTLRRFYDDEESKGLVLGDIWVDKRSATLSLIIEAKEQQLTERNFEVGDKLEVITS